MPRVGMNPYALGMRLFYALPRKRPKKAGMFRLRVPALTDAGIERQYDTGAGPGPEVDLPDPRRTLADYLFIKNFVDQDFTDRSRPVRRPEGAWTSQRMVWQYYVKSRYAQEYRDMVLASLYHPPTSRSPPEMSKAGTLYLVHHFEGKQLVQEYIANTMVGIEFLWGRQVQLETSEAWRWAAESRPGRREAERRAQEITWQRVLYTMKDKTLNRKAL